MAAFRNTVDDEIRQGYKNPISDVTDAVNNQISILK